MNSKVHGWIQGRREMEWWCLEVGWLPQMNQIQRIYDKCKKGGDNSIIAYMTLSHMVNVVCINPEHNQTDYLRRIYSWWGIYQPFSTCYVSQIFISPIFILPICTCRSVCIDWPCSKREGKKQKNGTGRQDLAKRTRLSANPWRYFCDHRVKHYRVQPPTV